MMLLELQMDSLFRETLSFQSLSTMRSGFGAKWNDKVGLYLFGLWIRKALSRVHTLKCERGRYFLMNRCKPEPKPKPVVESPKPAVLRLFLLFPSLL